MFGGLGLCSCCSGRVGGLGCECTLRSALVFGSCLGGLRRRCLGMRGFLLLVGLCGVVVGGIVGVVRTRIL
jgi:hypothetical protein